MNCCDDIGNNIYDCINESIMILIKKMVIGIMIITIRVILMIIRSKSSLAIHNGDSSLKSEDRC